MKKEKKAYEYSRDAFLNNPVASVNDCTGMSPAMPDSEAQASSQRELAYRKEVIPKGHGAKSKKSE